MLLGITVGVCAILAMLLVYRYDMYEREPWYMLLLTAGAGAAMMWLAGHIELAWLDAMHSQPWPALHIAMAAAITEEGLRLGLVACLAIFVQSQFNDPMDGIIYGSAAGLGMAVLESIDHMRFAQVTGPLPPPSEIIRLLGHLVMGGITGFGLGMARMGMRHWRRVLIGCVAVSVTMHFLWDWLAFEMLYARGKEWWQTLAAIAIMFGGIVFYGMLVVTGSDWSRKVFAPHSKRKLWGWPMTVFFSHEDDDPQG